MSANNPCENCIGEEGTGEDCCIDVFIILNSQEIHLFKEFSGYYSVENGRGAVFYTKEGCPYLDKSNQCGIHDIKPLYCRYYPIFITGAPYIDDKCPANRGSEYTLTAQVKGEIRKLQKKFPVYKKEWLWEEVQELIRDSLK
jgi:Fe-S-cluster containining protein